MKCCGKEKCDVAMLEGKTKTCIGVRCYNDTQCETVPMQPGEEEDLQIAHLTGRGLGNMKIGEQFDSCMQNIEFGFLINILKSDE